MSLSELVHDFRPIFYFHSEETYFPTTPDLYLENSELLDENENVVESVPITQAELYSYASSGYEDYRLDLINTNIINNDLDEDVPIYAYVKEENNKTYVTYLIFYAYSGPVNILGMDVGAHNADIEHITLEFDSNHELLRAYYAAHGYTEGTWVPEQDVTFRRRRPVVYVAKHTHANYFDRGIVFRYLGFGNDEMERKIRWEPDVVYIREENDLYFTPDNSWVYFPGRWMNFGIAGVVSQQWYNEIETESAVHDYVRERDLPQLQLDALIAAIFDGSLWELLEQLPI